MATIEKKCSTCGHVQTFTACPECKGHGNRLQSEEERARTGLIGLRCDACDGTGIKGGKVIQTLGPEARGPS